MDAIISQILRRLGITANYRGHRQLAVAIRLVLEDESRLCAVQKEVYQPIADELCCPLDTVERNIRTVIHRVWHTNKKRLFEYADYELTAPPTVSEFIDILANQARISSK